MTVGRSVRVRVRVRVRVSRLSFRTSGAVFLE